MAKLESNFKNMFLSLFTICFVVAALLAQVNKMTAKPIAQANAMKLVNAISEVVPPFDNDPVAEAYKMPDGQGDSLLVYPAKKGGKIVGYAVNSNSEKGFGGDIQIMVGIDAEHKIVNYVVLKHSETPGLGSKMAQWFKDASHPNRSIIGRNLSKNELKVSKDGGDVDAITAATISSRAFLEAVNKAYHACYGNDAQSGASKNEKKDAINTDAKSGSSTNEKGGKTNE